MNPLKPQSAPKAKLPKARSGDYKPTLAQIKQWHPKAETKEAVIRRLALVASRMRYRGQDYDADIIQFECILGLRALSFPQHGGGK